MGCCMSSETKLRTKPHYSSQELFHVQDKLVISQQPPPPIRHYHSRRISPVFPLSPTHSSSSFSRRCGDSESSSSSVLTSKDRSFSNEFLWSCLKENPHVMYLDSIKEYSSTAKLAADSPVPKQGIEKQSMVQNAISRSNSQKRIRSSSPSNLNRQKSFQKEYSDEILIRSPSPSRRFANWESWSRGISSISTGNDNESYNSKRVMGVKANASRHVKRDELNSPAPAPASVVRKKRNRETLVHRISSKIDESVVAEAMARYEGECAAMEEDINNPMISLDCFIFL